MGGSRDRPKIPDAAPPVATRELEEMDVAKKKVRRRTGGGRESTRLAGRMMTQRNMELKQILG